MEILLLLRKQMISQFFHAFNIKSSCLAQSYILYKFLIFKGKVPKLIMGYIVNHPLRIYYGHFWVECDGETHDIATETYLLDYPESQHKEIKEGRRIYKIVPRKVLRHYKNIDSDGFEEKRKQSYDLCMNDQFLDDVRNNATPEMYKLIAIAYDKLTK